MRHLALSEAAIRRIVLTELARQGSPYIPVGISARHVHLSARDLAVLFGPDYRLTPIRALSQPGQFAAAEQVTLVGPKGRIGKVRVLGPVRGRTQVELSRTDTVALGVKDCPVRVSGQLDGTPGIRIVGPKGELDVPEGLIVAARHLHMSDEQAQAYGVHNGQVVSLRVGGERPCLMEGVICRTGAGHELEVHVDTDEANACGLALGELLELVRDGEAAHACGGSQCDGHCRGCKDHGACHHCAGCKNKKKDTAPAARPDRRQETLDLVTERDVNEAFRADRKEVWCTARAIVTPAAADRSAETGVRIVRI